MAFFNSIAERIANEINPTAVLDAGCAMGLLVESLRKRGINAWGVDISEYAIQNVHPTIRPYCWVGNVIEAFPQNYDLITCIEILEHLTPQQAELAVHNMCTHSDDILFSSTPSDYKEATHINVQAPEYWAGLFAKFNFYHDLDFDATFITPWAMRFRKLHESIPRIISLYERHSWRLNQENKVRREFNIEQRNELATKESEIQDLISQKEALIRERAALIESAAQEKAALIKDFAQEKKDLIEAFEQEKDQLIQNISAKDGTVESLSRQVIEKETMIRDILNSRSWRLMQRAHKVRHFLIPPESRRERMMFAFFRALEILNRHGIKFFSQRLFAKLSWSTRRYIQKARLRTRPISKLQLQTIEVEGVLTAPEIKPHQATVDIVICVHNALSDTQRCLEGIIRYTTPPYTLILVDDGSDTPTYSYLKDFVRSQGAQLLRNDQPNGYTRAANQGLRHSSAEHVILLNSDTIVSPQWLDRLIACAESDESIGIVGPLSNTASWQSIPDIFDENNDWAENPLPEGVNAAEMGHWVAKYSARLYPRIPFLNGFCLLIKRQLIEQIGYFDEEAFGEGYGEENDYCLRTQKAGWQCAVSDDTFVYHAQSRSYSHTRRAELAKRADQILATNYGSIVMSENAVACRNDRILRGIRARNRVMPLRNEIEREGISHWEGKRVLFILPIAEPGGGGNVVIQEAAAMQRMGVDVKLLNLKSQQATFEQGYPEIELPVIFVDEPKRATNLFHKFDVVVATVFHSVRWMDMNLLTTSMPKRGYYIQDFEPDFFPEGSSYYQSAWESYTRFAEMIRVTKTEWNKNIITQRIGVESFVIGPSVDIDLFRPRRRKDPDWPDRPLRVAAMIRPNTPRRQPELTMQVLKQIADKHKNAIEIMLFGCELEDPDFQKLETNFPWRNAGILNRSKLAILLNEVDMFVDFSDFQAMGLTALESMACGVAVIVPEHGGASSFAQNNENALIIDSTSAETCFAALDRLILDEKLRQRLQEQAVIDACQYYPERAAFNMLKAFFEGPIE